MEYYEKGYCDMPICATSHIHDFFGKCDNLWAYYTGALAGENRSNRIIGIIAWRWQNKIKK